MTTHTAISSLVIRPKPSVIGKNTSKTVKSAKNYLGLSPKSWLFTSKEYAFTFNRSPLTSKEYAFTFPESALTLKECAFTSTGSTLTSGEYAFTPRASAFTPKEYAFTPRGNALTLKECAFTSKESALIPSKYTLKKGGLSCSAQQSGVEPVPLIAGASYISFEPLRLRVFARNCIRLFKPPLGGLGVNKFLFTNQNQ